MSPLGEFPGEVLARARDAGVQGVIVPSYDMASWAPVQALAANHEGVYSAYGLHPWAEDEGLDLDRLQELLQAGAVAVGEVGLDFATARTPAARTAQVTRFVSQVELAVELGLPLILHCRKATDELLSVLAEIAPGHPGVLHGFARSPELARRFLGQGLHLGLGGMITRPGAHRVRRAATQIPLDQVLLETDAPAVGMAGMPPEQVEPRHVMRVAQTLSQLRGEPVEEIRQRTLENAVTLFAIG